MDGDTPDVVVNPGSVGTAEEKADSLHETSLTKSQSAPSTDVACDVVPEREDGNGAISLGINSPELESDKPAEEHQEKPEKANAITEITNLENNAVAAFGAAVEPELDGPETVDAELLNEDELLGEDSVSEDLLSLSKDISTEETARKDSEESHVPTTQSLASLTSVVDQGQNIAELSKPLLASCESEQAKRKAAESTDVDAVEGDSGESMEVGVSSCIENTPQAVNSAEEKTSEAMDVDSQDMVTGAETSDLKDQESGNEIETLQHDQEEEAEHFEVSDSDKVVLDEDDDNLLGSLSKDQKQELRESASPDEAEDPLLGEETKKSNIETDKPGDDILLNRERAKEVTKQGKTDSPSGSEVTDKEIGGSASLKAALVPTSSAEAGVASKSSETEVNQDNSAHDVGIDPIGNDSREIEPTQERVHTEDTSVQGDSIHVVGTTPSNECSIVIDQVQSGPDLETGEKVDDDIEITGELMPVGRISVVAGLFKPKIEGVDEGEETSIEDVMARTPKKTVRGKRTLIIIHSGKIVEGFEELKVATCAECGKTKEMLYEVSNNSGFLYVCSQLCFNDFEKKRPTPSWINKVSFHVADKEPLPDLSVDWVGTRHCASKCAQCKTEIALNSNSYSWETMEFCSVNCVNRYQTILGVSCVYCKGAVKSSYLGKYCVRFGRELKQFCCNDCLEKYKPTVRICAYCQRDITKMIGSSCLAQIGDTGNFKDFCSVLCIVKYDDLLNLEDLGIDDCTVCNKSGQVRAKINFEEKNFTLCSDPCISAFKFVNQIKAENCDTCCKLIDKDKDKPFSITHYVGVKKVRLFCSQGCLNRFVTHSRQIVSCSWCRVKKYNFDLIRVEDEVGRLFFCSVVCLNQHATHKLRRVICSACPNQANLQYKATLPSGRGELICCSAACREKCKERLYQSPIITGVSSLLTQLPVVPVARPPSPLQLPPIVTLPPPAPQPPPLPAIIPVEVTQRVVFKRDLPPLMVNKTTTCRPKVASKGTYFRAPARNVETQTDFPDRAVYVPVPVPMYIPAPMMMYSAPYPVPLPIPLPIPVPIFLPVTMKTHDEVKAAIAKIVDEIPNNPLEADLLAMAAMIADDADSDSKRTDASPMPNGSDKSPENGNSVSPVDHSISNGKSQLEEDLLQMLATADIDPSLLVDSTLDSTTDFEAGALSPDEDIPLTTRKGKKRGRSSAGSKSKKKKVQNEDDEVAAKQSNLKLEYGLNAWRKWVLQKNLEIEALIVSGKKSLKPFKTDLLKMTPEEVCASLCFFVKEIKKPDGVPYAPDSVYYLCLGIQQYLYENTRVDNIFADFYYEKFSIFLDEVISEYVGVRGDEAYIGSRIEEEHLWECRQLGAHSPQVLLYTLMYFNTKFFGLKTVAEHHTLSFMSVVKSWRRVASGSLEGAKGSQITRLVTLKHIMPNKKKGGKSSSREMLENWENPLRCPVKLYEFYISKCPEGARNRSDLYYICPERSCVPDSPVWYSNRQVADEVLQRMINRTLLVRDVNESLQSFDYGDS